MPLLPITDHVSPRAIDECYQERMEDTGMVRRTCETCTPSIQRRNEGWQWDFATQRWVEPLAPIDLTAYMNNMNSNSFNFTFRTTDNTQEAASMPVTPYPRYAYCIECSMRFVRPAGTDPCEICYESTCMDCMSRVGHEHNGDMCDDCGYEIRNGGEARYCENDDVHLCTLHFDENHSECADGPYDGGDDGRYHGRPPVDGYGREATLEMIDQSYRADPRALGKRAAAVEIEAEYRGDGSEGRLYLPPSVGIGDDGSLSNGIEVTTPPAKGKALADVVTETMAKMQAGGYGVLASCGMHTHIDLRDKRGDTRFLSHLFNAFFAIEDILYAMQSRNRHASQYSIPLRNQYKFFDMYGQRSGDFDYTFYRQPKTVDGEYYVSREKERKYAGVRYAAFNFHSVYFRGSLECRLHEGCVDPDTALMWIDLLQTIIARVERGHSYAAMKQLVSMSVTRAKVNKFARYFGLTPEQKAFVIDRIENGQGFGFQLPHSIAWGVPIKGRPTGPPRRMREQSRRVTVFVGQQVQCFNCLYVFHLRAMHRNCPNCSRALVDRYGDRLYTRSMTDPLPAQTTERRAPTDERFWTSYNLDSE